MEEIMKKTICLGLLVVAFLAAPLAAQRISNRSNPDTKFERALREMLAECYIARWDYLTDPDNSQAAVAYKACMQGGDANPQFKKDTEVASKYIPGSTLVGVSFAKFSLSYRQGFMRITLRVLRLHEGCAPLPYIRPVLGIIELVPDGNGGGKWQSWQIRGWREVYADDRRYQLWPTVSVK
jgi:hypothetical protein